VAGKLIDISQAVDARAGVFPGDTPFSFEWKWDQDRGSSCNVSAVTLSPHVGSHADAPLHFRSGAPSIGEVDLSAYVGPCQVVAGPASGLIHRSHLQELDIAGCERILFKTHEREDTAFPERFVALSAEAADFLVQRGVRLVGLDTPSVDSASSKSLEAHHTLGRGGVAILENLQLAQVTPGRYELIALPLRWMGLDAAPVRAVLRTL
jgi:arylformamidase